MTVYIAANSMNESLFHIIFVVGENNEENSQLFICRKSLYNSFSVEMSVHIFCVQKFILKIFTLIIAIKTVLPFK